MKKHPKCHPEVTPKCLKAEGRAGSQGHVSGSSGAGKHALAAEKNAIRPEPRSETSDAGADKPRIFRSLAATNAELDFGSDHAIWK